MATNNPPNTETVDFPHQPVILDTIALERSSSFSGTYTPIEPGTPFSPKNHSVKQAADFAGTFLLKQGAGKDREFQERIWGKYPSTQDVYNYGISYSGESNACPIFKRRYLELRDTYAPRTKASAFTGIYAIAITAAGSGYITPVVAITDSGSGSGATAIAVTDPTTGAIVKITLKAEGASYTTATVSVTITDSTSPGGSGATATAVLQPAACVLVKEDTDDAPEPYGSLFLLVERIYETLPGPILTGYELQDYTGTVTPFTKRRVLASGASGSNVASDGTYSTVEPFSSVVSILTTRKTVDTTALSRSWTTGRHVSLPRVCTTVPTQLPFDDSNGAVVFVAFYYQLTNYSGNYVITVTESWSLTPVTGLAPTKMIEQGASWVTPFGSGSLPECLHAAFTVSGSTGSSGTTPVGADPNGRAYGAISWSWSFGATSPASLAGTTVYLVDEQTPYAGGFLRHIEQITV